MESGTNSPRPLTTFRPGDEIEISSIPGCSMRKRLADLGITAGACIKVLRSDFSGPVLILVKCVRLAIGRGMASKIICQKTSGCQLS
ncbi:MAG TPA: FeoA family protein [Caldisericia bacterium]|nr:MAG: FeoA domain protein [bacterium ADurb.Bin132]HNY61105.1 FeoA family protein [Caldisericia bacterium]HOC79578.1 FeoA family protein [Caldisericia bacterium]HOG70115.1 FeoA family protein [Caldisericia bacterium]HPA65471.1 FeoA family protein [Caldisericia bacterium]